MQEPQVRYQYSEESKENSRRKPPLPDHLIMPDVSSVISARENRLMTPTETIVSNSLADQMEGLQGHVETKAATPPSQRPQLLGTTPNSFSIK
jgi:hypothetical protein